MNDPKEGTSEARKKGGVYVISGPSGVGKSTLIKAIIKRVPRIELAVSYTTRKPRDGEIDGVHYNFTDKELFAGLRNEGKFLEWAEVHGEYYGTPEAEVSIRVEGGIDVLLDIDSQGWNSVREHDFSGKKPDLQSVFVLPPSLEILRKRLEERGANNLEKRIANITKEMEQLPQYDLWIINKEGKSGEAVQELEDFIAATRLARG